ncbi:SDR family oxidoreductase [Streptomyces sp. HC44]|uniref:SDR family oxidoreductase n=1 Tax=Streptomyces scabichelini TaxID=2711217 RepID=A0A6G4VIT9_9ACTN|nr:SDR family oxidoreductase [Streptomyces scabichelini]NGO13697.1 SDR family oxidoreductase [Streptomyces scabichelini]
MSAGAVGGVALVTGASSGIGAAVAGALAATGAHVVLVARRIAPLAHVADETAARGGRASVLVADLAAEGEPRRVVAQTVELFGPPTVLVNCAGAVRLGQVHELPPKHWELMLRLNLTVPYLLSHEVLPYMRKSGGGTIVNIGSSITQETLSHTAGYAAGKQGLNVLTELVALENRDHGIRAVAVCPGWVHTELAAGPDELGASKEELLTPDDVADAVVWAVTRPPRVSVGPVIHLAPTSSRAGTRASITRLTGTDGR